MTTQEPKKDYIQKKLNKILETRYDTDKVLFKKKLMLSSNNLLIKINYFQRILLRA